MVYFPSDVELAIKNKCQRYRHSPKTAKSYIYWTKRFLNWSRKDLRYVSKKDVNAFLQKLQNQDKAGNTLNVAHMALKFFFEDVMDRKMWIDIKYSKTPKRFPEVLTKEEVKKLLNAISNWKHRLMIEFLYSSGLRVSELLSIKIKDLDLEKNYGFVRNGKGGKDRLIVLARVVREKIKGVIEIENLSEKDYLFKSNRGRKYSMKSVQKIVQNASRIAGIDKKIHPHTLRHSFATHLIENGYDVSNVQSMLGHKSPETTMVYVHMASPNLVNIKSPLETL